MSKYHAKKVTVDGMTFDSQKEYHRWCELKLLERAGKIFNLQRQVPYVVIPGQIETIERYGKGGKRLKDKQKVIEQASIYKADFVYTEDGKLVVEDTKGFKTEAYKMKRKLMLERFGIRIRET